MPTITQIKHQVKQSDRYSIYLDGKYAFSLRAAQLAETSLAIGQTLTERELEQFQSDSDYGKALQAAYNLLSYRARSTKELADRLKRKSYESDIIDRVIANLEELGLINDEEFAKNWVAQPKSALRSQRRLRQELQQKQIDLAAIGLSIESAADDHDEAAIKIIVEKLSKKNPALERQRLVTYLVRQGFNYGDIKKVLDQDFSEIRRP